MTLNEFRDMVNAYWEANPEQREYPVQDWELTEFNHMSLSKECGDATCESGEFVVLLSDTPPHA